MFIAPFAATWTSLADAKGEPTTIGAGWVVTHTDINPATGAPNPIWGGDGTDVAISGSYGTSGI